MALVITDATLDEVLATDKLVIIDFWAEWCGPCKMIGPIIDQIGEEYADKVVVGKVDVDNNDDTTSKYGIRNIPTVLYIKDGKVVEDAKLKAKFFMPEMPGMPYMEHEGTGEFQNGSYRFIINFCMNGTWQYNIRFKTSDEKVHSVKSSVTF